jgi:hypothetical protein
MRGFNAVIVGAFIGLVAGPALATPVDCEPARCAVQADLAQCPCDTAGNHGQYVSCVSHALNVLKKNGGIPKECKGRIQRCAARSTCGKPGFVTCLIPTDTCTVDPTTGLGTCANDPTLTCVVDLDCGSICKIKSSDMGCTDAGGTVGTGTTCCAACATP